MESLDSTNAFKMSIRKFTSILLQFITASLLLTSCHHEKKIQLDEVALLRPRSALYLLKQNEKTWFPYHHIGMKLEGNFIAGEEETGFKANLRMSQDSAVWLSISPALGIEVARALITSDSLSLLSKIPDNKFGYITTISDLENWLHFELDLSDLQHVLLGRPIGIDKIGGKFKSDVDGSQYIINTRYKRRIKKNLNFINQAQDSTDKKDSEREKRKLQKIDQEGLVISQYWIDGKNYLLDKMQFTDLISHKTITIIYESWNNEIPENPFPNSGIIQVNDDGITYRFLWEINKMVTDRIFDFPFEIPEDYEIKKKL
jgi:Domain of unknown function (DUF4292)